MAAIIAQISLQAANRRRDQTKRIPIDKSNVKLPAFDLHFDPCKHNAYTMRLGKTLSVSRGGVRGSFSNFRRCNYIERVMSVRAWHEKVVGRIIDEGFKNQKRQSI